MVAGQSRIIHYLVLFFATTVLTNEVQSVSVATTEAPTPSPKGPSPGPSTPGSHEPLVAKSSPVKGADGQPPSPSAPHHPPAGDSTIAPGVPRPSISIAPLLVATASSKAGVEKIDPWLAPICEQLETIVPKQAFKIQSQFKRIVELTNGKLSICFLEHYKIDPSLNPISKAQMTNLCHSRNSPHFKAFLGCAAENWDVLAEKELDAITNARDDHVKNHKHDNKDGESGAPSLLHGDDEVKSILNDVVSKALFDNKSDHGKKSDIKLIDLSDKNSAVSSSPKPSAPSGSPAMPAKGIADVMSVERKILNDPNTVMVFMDDSKPPLHLPGRPQHSTNLFGSPTVSTTAIPHSNDKAKPPPTSTKPTTPPHDAPSTTKASIKTTSKPVPVNKDADKPTPTPPPTTMKPAPSTSKRPHMAEIGTTLAPKNHAPESAKQVTTTVAPTKSSPKPSSKAAGEPSSRGALDSHPAATTTTTTVVPKVKPGSTTSLPTMTPTEKPLETLEAVLKRQEAEKIEFEKKLKMEREALIKKLQKKQDEIDAQNAIAAMQSHRNHANIHDSRMHQIEHERQMSIDPIGHSLKHQQFEMRRQQRFGGR